MDSFSDSEVSDLEVSPRRLVVTKCLDEDSGLVTIRGWTERITRGRLALFTVLDEHIQTRWLRLAGYPSSWHRNSEPMEIAVSRSSIAHPISVIMELLREIRSVHGSRVEDSGARYFTVDWPNTSVTVEAVGCSDACPWDRFGSLLPRATLDMKNERDCGKKEIAMIFSNLTIVPVSKSINLWRSRNQAVIRSIFRRSVQ